MKVGLYMAEGGKVNLPLKHCFALYSYLYDINTFSVISICPSFLRLYPYYLRGYAKTPILGLTDPLTTKS